jgi:hypothetical protein
MLKEDKGIYKIKCSRNIKLQISGNDKKNGRYVNIKAFKEHIRIESFKENEDKGSRMM